MYDEILNKLTKEEKEQIKDINIKTSILDINRYIQEKEACTKCTSLQNCPLDIKGRKSRLDVYEDTVNLVYYDCGLLKDEINRKKTESNLNFKFVNESYKRATIETLYQHDARTMLNSYIAVLRDKVKNNENFYGFYLYGSVGSGKTYSLCAVANLLSSNGFSCTVLYYPDFVRGIKSTFIDNSTEEEVNKLKNVDCLFIDDFGIEVASDWFRDEIFGPLINYRSSNELPTFFTSNFELKELLSNKYVNDIEKFRVYSRIDSLVQIIQLNDKTDYRRSKKDEN